MTVSRLLWCFFAFVNWLSGAKLKTTGNTVAFAKDRIAERSHD
jgi:hypothetical protein